MIIGDPIVQKILERVLKRRLTEDEKRGIKPVIIKSHRVRIPQINRYSIYSKSNK